MYLLKNSYANLLTATDAEKLVAVQQMLTDAVTLELATLPTYLTGAFSVKTGTNIEARALVMSVAIEEMLHMTLSANVLFAIGGTLSLKDLGSSLQFPTPLPDGVVEGLVVHLAGLSKEQLSNVFMQIERPDTTAILPGETEPDPIPKGSGYYSISDFYYTILNILEEIQDLAFATDHSDKQLDISNWLPEAVPNNPKGIATNFATAKEMILTICREGEGAKLTGDPIDPYGGLKDGGKTSTLAHYFKFAEIYHGNRLIPDKTAVSGYSYTGAEIPLDTDNIYDVLPNAALDLYPEGSGARIAGSAFYDTYMRLLTAVDQSFNGTATGLNASMGLMYELMLTAERVMQFTVEDPITKKTYVAAPPFQLERNADYLKDMQEDFLETVKTEAKDLQNALG